METCSVTMWEEDNELESALETTSPCYLSQHFIWLMCSPSTVCTYYLLSCVLACFSQQQCEQVQWFSAVGHLLLAPVTPRLYLRMLGDISDCFNWELLQLQWVGAKKLLKMKIMLKKYCKSLSYWRTWCTHCLQHSAHPTAKGMVDTQIQDKWMHVHMKILVSVNF